MSLQQLAEIRKGAFATEVSETLAELVKACRKTGVKGKMTITLEVKPASEESIHIVDDISVKMPKPAKSITVFFDAADGSLSRDRQEQPELFRPVETPAQAISG